MSDFVQFHEVEQPPSVAFVNALKFACVLLFFVGVFLVAKAAHNIKKDPVRELWNKAK